LCFTEISHSNLKATREELKIKEYECESQQEEIQTLFSQIYELQLRIRNLKKENSDLHAIYESSKNELVEQVRYLISF
jgi:hypothetical protein